MIYSAWTLFSLQLGASYSTWLCYTLRESASTVSQGVRENRPHENKTFMHITLFCRWKTINAKSKQNVLPNQLHRFYSFYFSMNAGATFRGSGLFHSMWSSQFSTIGLEEHQVKLHTMYIQHGCCLSASSCSVLTLNYIRFLLKIRFSWLLLATWLLVGLPITKHLTWFDATPIDWQVIDGIVKRNLQIVVFVVLNL